MIHPYSQPVLLSLAVTLIVARRRSEAEGYLCRFFAAALPALLYVVFVDISNGIVRAHSALGEMDSPPVYAYILGLGFPLLLCIPGLIAAPRTLLKRYWPLILLSLIHIYHRSPRTAQPRHRRRPHRRLRPRPERESRPALHPRLPRPRRPQLSQEYDTAPALRGVGFPTGRSVHKIAFSAFRL